MKLYLSITALVSSLLLVGCATDQPPADTADLNSLQNLKQGSTPTGTSVNKIRQDALKNTALTLGAQGGLSWRAQQINALTMQNAASLDQIFNFQHLVLDNNVLPPVLVEANQSFNLAGPTAIRLSGHVYKIIQQAQFVTAPPNWRQYLLLNYPSPPTPDTTLLPQNSQEREIWTQYINIGWQQGVQQANNIYQDELAKLKRDYNGMILYRSLLAQNIVSKPYVAESDLGTTTNKDHSQLSVNDRVLRITALPELNPNTKEWNPTIETNNGATPPAK